MILLGLAFFFRGWEHCFLWSKTKMVWINLKTDDIWREKQSWYIHVQLVYLQSEWVRIKTWDGFVNKLLVLLGRWGNVMYVICQPSAELSKLGNQRLVSCQVPGNGLQGSEGKLFSQMIKTTKMAWALSLWLFLALSRQCHALCSPSVWFTGRLCKWIWSFCVMTEAQLAAFSLHAWALLSKLSQTWPLSYFKWVGNGTSDPFPVETVSLHGKSQLGNH